MSCEQNTIAYEAACESFFDIMADDYDFACLIYANMLDHMAQWKEKEFGWDEEPYNIAFETLWNWDCEATHEDPKACALVYIDHLQELEHQKRLWLKSKQKGVADE